LAVRVRRRYGAHPPRPQCLHQPAASCPSDRPAPPTPNGAANRAAWRWPGTAP